MQGPWDWRSRWRLYAGAGAGLGALIVTLVLVVPGDGAARQQLVAADPSSTPSAAPSPTATPTPEPTPTATPTPTPPAVASPSAGPRPSVRVASSALLSQRYVEETFGQGRPALVQGVPGIAASWARCPWYAGPHFEDVLSRSWSWSGEVAVTELVGRLDSAADAEKVLAECLSAKHREAATNATATRLDVADGGTLLRTSNPYFIAQLAGARVGNAVVLLSWLQSGPVPTDEAPIERALRDAVARATGGEEGPPSPVAAVRVPDAVRGMISRTQLPEVRWGRELDWLFDTPAYAATLQCTSHNGEGPDLSTVDTALTRKFSNGPYSDVVMPEQLEVTRGHARDAADAEQRFTACRGDRPTIPDVGDDAFYAPSDVGHPESPGRVFVRAGATFYVLSLNFIREKDYVAVARAVVAADDTRP